MKKLIFIFCLLFSFSSKAEKSFDVDFLYNECSQQKYSKSWNLCLGYIRGITEAYFTNAPHSYKERCYVKDVNDVIDRFKIMYKRNMFDISGDSYTAIIKSIVNLCPLNEDETDIIIKRMELDPYFNKKNKE